MSEEIYWEYHPPKWIPRVKRDRQCRPVLDAVDDFRRKARMLR